MSDEELMERYRDGSHEAFNRLYEKYSPMVYAFARRRLKSFEVDDFYQKVWRQLHEKRGLFRDRPFAPWFFVLIRNLLIDEYRARGRNRELPAEFLEKLPIDSTDETNELEELLVLLPAESRELVRRYYLEGVSYQELETETGLSQTNLRQRLSRAVRGLREKVRGANEI